MHADPDSRPRLHSLIFEVTQRCNHACLHCYNVWEKPEADYPRGELDTAQTLALLSKALDETRCSNVTLTGGEPLLRCDLDEILDLIHDHGARATVISNGHLLTERRISELLDREVGLFELPLLSHRREVHDRLSGSTGALDAVLNSMSHLRYQGGQFVAVFVITRLNSDDVHSVIRLAFAFGARGLMLNRFNPGGRGRANMDELLPTIAQVQRALTVANDAVSEFGFPISCSIPIQPCLVDVGPLPNLGFGYCAAGTERAYHTLDPLGNVRPCNHTSTILGNLFHESFADLIASERMATFTRALPTLCTLCALGATCQGGCKAAAQECYDSLWAEEPFLHQNRALASSNPARVQ